MKTIYEMSIEQLEDRFEFGYSYPVPHILPVHKSEDKWTIRILTGSSQHGAVSRMRWDYFHCDNDGVVTSSPRGLAKQFNKKVRITGLETWGLK